MVMESFRRIGLEALSLLTVVTEHTSGTARVTRVVFDERSPQQMQSCKRWTAAQRQRLRTEISGNRTRSFVVWAVWTSECRYVGSTTSSRVNANT